MEMVKKVAVLDNSILLLGETGVGKEIIAEYIHRSSPRHEGPFIPINCGAIPETLVESELFGHEKGAFTGAVAKKLGRFERANGGTIFLDEIGELPPIAQVRLLRVLQNRYIERVGGTESIPVDIRVIAATHRDLEKMIREKTFRKDLWFRINIFPIIIPPLRDRKMDIPSLTQFFIEKKSKELNLSSSLILAPGTIDYLMNYDWPGNVRQLENEVERALILQSEGLIYFDHLFSVLPKGETSAQFDDEKEILSMDEVMSRHIKRALETANGQIHGKGGAAELIGINPSTFRSKMKKLGIRWSRPIGSVV